MGIHTKQTVARVLIFALLLSGGLLGCTTTSQSTATPTAELMAETLSLPPLAPLPLDGRQLRVVATTNIIGDVVNQVGGTAIELTTLMPPGQDPHGYEPAARDLTAVASADVIFVNGWQLEEGLIDDLAEIAPSAILVPISAGVEPLPFADDDHEEGHEESHENDEEADHDSHGAFDPHVWFDIDHVLTWVDNVATVLTTLDPTQAETVAAQAAAYRAELTTLQNEIAADVAQIPAERRILVTNHDSLGYLAHAYGFELVGTIMRGGSTLAEPSAADLADLITLLQDRQVCTLFAETTVSDNLAQTVAAELDLCPTVQVIPLYTGSIGPAGSGADSYIGMMRANLDAITSALK